MTDATNVVVAIGGAVYVGTDVASPPTDASTPLGEGWVDVGYLSEDAVKEKVNVSTNDITAWQNADIVRKVVTSFGVEYSFTMIETNESTVELYYGKALDATKTEHKIGGGGFGTQQFVIDAIDPSGQTVRRYIPSGEVTERGEVSLSGSDALGYETTIACYPSEALDGDTVHVFYGTAIGTPDGSGPDLPSLLTLEGTATADGGSFAWTANLNGHVATKIEYSIDNGAWVDAEDITTPFVVTGLTASYHVIRARVVTSEGNSNILMDSFTPTG